ncbi:MAG: amidohydrolase family protein, partial [Acidimicrobiales bacterium]
AEQRGAEVHAHVSEQTLENEQCAEYHGLTPTALLAESGLLSRRFTAVHGTHLSEADQKLLAAAGSSVCFCPTTERDLGDGIGPSSLLASAGVAIGLGSDSHAVIDLLEEARAIELDERLASRQRGIHAASDLLAMATRNGHNLLGWDNAGTIAVGQRADLVTVSLESVRTAGTTADTAVEAVVFAASAADVCNVVIDGSQVVADGTHMTVDVAAELHKSIVELMEP